MNEKCEIGSRQGCLSGALNHHFPQEHGFDSELVSKFLFITFSLKRISSLSITIDKNRRGTAEKPPEKLTQVSSLVALVTRNQAI